MWLSNSHPATVPVEEVENILRSDKVKGLGQRAAEERYLTFGYNELVGKEDDPVWKKYLEQFKNPLILLLLCSAIVSVAMKQFDDAASITLAIVIVVTVGFIQEYRSEKTLEKLKKLVPPVCVCIRDGRQVATYWLSNDNSMSFFLVSGKFRGQVLSARGSGDPDHGGPYTG